MTTKDFDEHVGAIIRRTRMEAGWSQADLASALSVHGFPIAQQTIYKIEHGLRPLRLDESIALAEVFGVSITSLVDPLGGEKVSAAAVQLQRMNAMIDRTEHALRDVTAAIECLAIP